MCCSVRIQCETNFSFSQFRENFRIFEKISLRKLTKIAETITMKTIWGVGHTIEHSLLKMAF
jgi:hypothetical protein